MSDKTNIKKEYVTLSEYAAAADSPSPNNNKKSRKKLIIIAAASLAVLILLTVLILVFWKKPAPAPKPAPKPTPSPTATPAPTPTPEAVNIPIDFATLQWQYPDAYAWIHIPDTNVNYPVFQHPTDNSYYLERNMDGSVGYPGCIYTENFNSKTFEDPNTILYGHNMKDGTMFKHLHKFKDLEFFNSHRTMYIYTPTQILEYRIFAAYVADSRHLLFSYDYTNPNVYTEYLNEVMMKKGNIDKGMNLNSANKIITMQTCTGNDDTRYLVQAVLADVKGEPDIIIPDSLVTTGSAIAQ